MGPHPSLAAMRIVRQMLAVLLVGSVAMLPVASAMATARASSAEMAVSMTSDMAGDWSDDCPCCNPAKADPCPLPCCHLQALAVEGVALAEPTSERFGDHIAAPVAFLTLRPDPPPPRL